MGLGDQGSNQRLSKWFPSPPCLALTISGLDFGGVRSPMIPERGVAAGSPLPWGTGQMRRIDAVVCSTGALYLHHLVDLRIGPTFWSSWRTSSDNNIRAVDGSARYLAFSFADFLRIWLKICNTCAWKPAWWLWWRQWLSFRSFDLSFRHAANDINLLRHVTHLVLVMWPTVSVFRHKNSRKDHGSP